MTLPPSCVDPAFFSPSSRYTRPLLLIDGVLDLIPAEHPFLTAVAAAQSIELCAKRTHFLEQARLKDDAKRSVEIKNTRKPISKINDPRSDRVNDRECKKHLEELERLGLVGVAEQSEKWFGQMTKGFPERGFFSYFGHPEWDCRTVEQLRKTKAPVDGWRLAGGSGVKLGTGAGALVAVGSGLRVASPRAAGSPRGRVGGSSASSTTPLPKIVQQGSASPRHTTRASSPHRPLTPWGARSSSRGFAQPSPRGPPDDSRSLPPPRTTSRRRPLKRLPSKSKHAEFVRSNPLGLLKASGETTSFEDFLGLAAAADQEPSKPLVGQCAGTTVFVYSADR